MSGQLDTLDQVAYFLADAFESGDAERTRAALVAVANSKGLSELAAASGIKREELRAALTRGELTLETTLAIMKVIDLHLPGRMH
ncbi:MAG TPA: addiction module antidote protein [Telluria sp.]|nr:addiction module antidote protein [Telluria sp.]